MQDKKESWAMPYVKVIQSGNIIEVYEMERKPYNKKNDTSFSKRQKDEEGYEQQTLQGLRTNLQQVSETIRRRNIEKISEGIENNRMQRKQRKDERRGQTLRDGKNKVRRLALANFTADDWLMTLTYADNMQDVKQADKDFKAFIRKLRQKDKNIKYLAVREFQKRGAVHFHILINYEFCVSKYGEEDFITELFQREKEMGELWGHGFVDLQTLNANRSKNKEYEGKAVDNVGAYIAKYMNKSADDERLKGHKLYLTSRNLEKPIVITDLEAVITCDLLELHTKKETFTNSYESEYLGKIIYKEYNMTRIKEQLNDKDRQNEINSDNLEDFIDKSRQQCYSLLEMPIIYEEEQ